MNLEGGGPLDEIRLRVKDAMRSSPRGLSQSTIAREIGMSTDALSRSLNGQRNFSAGELAKLAGVFDVSLGWLITGDPRPESFVDESKDPVPWRRDQIAETVAFPAGAYREVGLTTGSVPLLDPDTTPEAAAGLVAKKFGEKLDRPFVHDLPAAIEACYGVGVFVSAEGPDFDARAMRVRDLTYIVVRATGAWYQANLVLARELGELLSGRESRHWSAKPTTGQLGKRICAGFIDAGRTVAQHRLESANPSRTCRFPVGIGSLGQGADAKVG